MLYFVVFFCLIVLLEGSRIQFEEVFFVILGSFLTLFGLWVYKPGPLDFSGPANRFEGFLLKKILTNLIFNDFLGAFSR